MLLRKVEVVGSHGFCRQPVVNITVKGQHRLLGVFRRKGQGPVGVAVEIEQRELVGKIHQVGDIGRRQVAQLIDQRLRAVEIGRQGMAGNVGRRGVVEGLGGRK